MRKLLLLLAFVSGAAHADVNLCWSRSASGSESWQRCAGSTVSSRATVGNYGQYSGGTFRAFDQVPANEAVYICEVDRPVGAGDGCPSSGNYTRERYVLKSTLAPVEPPPPPPPPADPYAPHGTIEL